MTKSESAFCLFSLKMPKAEIFCSKTLEKLAKRVYHINKILVL